MTTIPNLKLPEEILIVGLARNISRRMDKTIQVLRRATRQFDVVHFLVIESDSTDDTLTRLSRLASEVPNLRFISLGRLRDQYPMRTERIAFCRNTYLEELRNNPLYNDVSHVVCLDFDGVCKDLTASALVSCWRQPEPWNVCAANQSDFYYDIYALRHPTWCPGDCWQEYQRLLPIVGKRSAREMSIFSRMIHIPHNRPMIEVDSAFGGLAVYQRDAILSARYVGSLDDGTPICEHVPLCLKIKEAGYRVFLNPTLINAHRTRHASSKKFFRRARRDLWSSIVGEVFTTDTASAAA